MSTVDEELMGIVTGKPMDYPEAAQYFAEKLEMTVEEFAKLQAQYKTAAFTISGYTSLQIIKAYKSRLTEAILNGTTLRDFQEEMNDILVSEGYDPADPWAMENIFRTNLQTAYSVGAYKEMTAPAVMQQRPYWQYDAVDDDRTRENHLLLDGLVYPADHPFWDTHYPPNGFRCRCSVTSLSQREVDTRGLRVESRVPPIPSDTGFRVNPAKVPFEPDLDSFPPALAKAYKVRNATGGPTE